MANAMPEADDAITDTAEQAPSVSRRRPSNRRGRRDISGVIHRANLSRSDIDPTSDGVEKPKFPFRPSQDTPTRSGPRSALWDITQRQVEHFENLVYVNNASTHRAARVALGVAYSTFWDWYNAGSNPNCTDESKRAFFNRIEYMRAIHGIKIEHQVTQQNPEFAATHHPNLRSRPNDPGWTQEQTIRHSGYDGGPIAFKLEITTGYATREEPRELMPGETEEP